MADIEMIKHHTLPLAAARALVQRAADDLGKEYHLVSHWTGNTLHFTRTGIQGQMEVTASEIRLEVTLGFLLKLLKAKFVENIEQSFDTLLAKAHATHRSATKPKTAVRGKPAAKAAKKAPRKG